MLESEAKTKWCPMFRDSGSCVTNRNYQGFPENSSCLGSRCACWVDTGYDDAEKERTGRCGLAR